MPNTTTLIIAALLFILGLAEFAVMYFRVKTVQSYIFGTILIIVVNIAASILAVIAIYGWAVAVGTLAIFVASMTFPTIGLIMKLLDLPERIAVAKIIDDTVNNLDSTINRLKA